MLLFVAGSGVGIAWPHLSAAAMTVGETTQGSITTLGAALTGVGGDMTETGHSAQWLYGTFAVIVLCEVLLAHRVIGERARNLRRSSGAGVGSARWCS
ncbi:hypothetical protein AB0C18_33580 [Nonomuraea muscovyensis]|uniref:hypothetical protein n=1 Tax=Nonomuraea muscovyensis TaxID=1124761 RepID=UPI0033C40232